MSTLTLELPEALFTRLQAASAARHIPPAQLACETLDKALPQAAAGTGDEAPSAYDMMKEGFGCVDSGVNDLATHPRHMEGFGRWGR
jgi:hypothetical protein